MLLYGDNMNNSSIYLLPYYLAEMITKTVDNVHRDLNMCVI
jgi:hypothetical protein